ncbi:hypothetical protein D3C72_1932640 [compost metagenome]
MLNEEAKGVVAVVSIQAGTQNQRMPVLVHERGWHKRFLSLCADPKETACLSLEFVCHGTEWTLEAKSLSDHRKIEVTPSR